MNTVNTQNTVAINTLEASLNDVLASITALHALVASGTVAITETKPAAEAGMVRDARHCNTMNDDGFVYPNRQMRNRKCAEVLRALFANEYCNEGEKVNGTSGPIWAFASARMNDGVGPVTAAKDARAAFLAGHIVFVD